MAPVVVVVVVASVGTPAVHVARRSNIHVARGPQGLTLKLLQGRRTSANAIRELMTAVGANEACSVTLVNYTKDRRPFSHTLQLEPLRDVSGKVQCRDVYLP